jgi:hypothetical protein
MRVLQVYWPLKDASGPITQAWKTQELFRRAGHTLRTAMMTQANKPPAMSRDGSVAPGARPKDMMLMGGDRLSFHPAQVRATLMHLVAYRPDVVLFVHPCPHVSTTKLKTWQLLYTALPGRKVVWWTDLYWQDFYPWIADVRSCMDRVICASNAKLEQVHATFRPDAVLAPLPQLLPAKPPLYKASRTGAMWAHQWRSWKGIRRLWETWHEIPMQVWAAGTGQEYRRNRLELKHVCENALERDFPIDPAGNVHIMGTITFQQVVKLYQEALVAIDWTGASKAYEGHYNSATLEPMMYGCIPWLRPGLVEPHTAIPKESVLVQEGFAPGEVGATIEALLKDKAAQQRKRKAAWEFVRAYVDPVHTISQILGDM